MTMIDQLASGKNLHGLDITNDDLPEGIWNNQSLEMKEAPNYLTQSKTAETVAMDDGENELNLDSPMIGNLRDVQAVMHFVEGGNAYFTIRSQKTGTRYTYRVNEPKDQREGNTPTPWGKKFFVALLTGPENTSDYQYLGMLQAGKFRLTRASKMTMESKPVVAFAWAMRKVFIELRMPPNMEIWHEGRCGRCGRRLTVPESVASGIGPECAKRGGW